jgi:hypothetical protein
MESGEWCPYWPRQGTICPSSSPTSMCLGLWPIHEHWLALFTSTLKTETICTLKTWATMPISTWCKDPRVGSTSIKNHHTHSESASELYRLSDRHLSEKLVPTFEDREWHVVSVTDPHDRILGFLDWSRYFFFQGAPQLYPRGWVDPVPDPVLLRKSGSAGNRSQTSGSVARNSDH